MPDIINVSVENKIATKTDDTEYVCGNSVYVAKFAFDSEWDAYDTKTARFSYNGSYIDIVFTGTECHIPIISGTYFFNIGVYAGNLHTTTPARVPCKKSILCDTGFPADPPDDVYNQIMAKLNSLGSADPEAIAKAVADYLAAHPIEETDPTVPEWAKAETKPTYTANEVGAISQGDLQTATNNALAQAKASGEFDGAGMDITGATVGQIAKITAVDESGKPTAWSPVDMPTGGGGELTWHGWDNVIVPEGGLNAFDFTVLASGEKLSDHKVKGMFIYSPPAASAADGVAEAAASLIVNGDYKFNLATFVRGNTGQLRILLTVENGHLVVRYYKRDTDNAATFPATTVTINHQDLDLIGALSKSAVTVIGYGQTLLQFNQIQSVKINSIGTVAKGVEFDVQVLY